MHSTALHRSYPLLKTIIEIAEQDNTYQEKLDNFDFKTLNQVISHLENQFANEQKNIADQKHDE